MKLKTTVKLYKLKDRLSDLSIVSINEDNENVKYSQYLSALSEIRAKIQEILDDEEKK